jgi:hypothetical protein
MFSTKKGTVKVLADAMLTNEGAKMNEHAQGRVGEVFISAAP